MRVKKYLKKFREVGVSENPSCAKLRENLAKKQDELKQAQDEKELKSDVIRIQTAKIKELKKQIADNVKHLKESKKFIKENIKIIKDKRTNPQERKKLINENKKLKKEIEATNVVLTVSKRDLSFKMGFIEIFKEDVAKCVELIKKLTPEIEKIQKRMQNLNCNKQKGKNEK